jgi:heme oxygenase
VHTDPNSRQVLEVGVGRVNTLFMAIDNDKDFAMYAGPVFSYYEFHQPAEQRMTDEEWKEMLLNDKAPDRPTWTNSYIP